MNNKTLIPVSCYISAAQKISLEFDVIYYKNLTTEEGKARNTINKNISFILDSFIDKYMDNIEEVKELSNRNMMRDMSSYQRQLISYTLKLTTAFIEKFDLFKKKCEDELDFNFSKTTFYNIILLDYYLHNKADIAKWQMEHWTQDYYKKRNVENTKIEDVVKQLNMLI